MNSLRNFSIIAHIDHGKTTLTDRLLQYTHTVSAQDFHERMMDSNPIEKERGITIKLAPVRMVYTRTKNEALSTKNGKSVLSSQSYVLNLIDTPGHVDFAYEVSRSLAACEGVILLVDASQGIQAQTLTNFEKAKNLGLVIIPVLNKIDLPNINKEEVLLECMETFGVEEKDILPVSAKTGEGVPELLEAIIAKIPPPAGRRNASLKGMIVTSKYDAHKGAVAYVRIIDGVLAKNSKLILLGTKQEFTPIEFGFFIPGMKRAEQIGAGEVGYIATGLKELQNLRVGDTFTTLEDKDQVTALPDFKLPQPMVYMEIYPLEGDNFSLLLDAMSKLALHDASLNFVGTHSAALGNGLRVGFLGILHAEIVLERLKREFAIDLIATAPTVTYQLMLTNGEKMTLHSPSQMPDPAQIKEIKEPVATVTIFSPSQYYGGILRLVQDKRGVMKQVQDVGVRMRMQALVPLAEIITDMHDKLKSLSSGFASLEYEVTDYLPLEAVKISILVHHEVVDALSFIVVREKAEAEARRVVNKLKEVLPRQQFEVPIQAAIGAKVIARETIKAYRKDVTAKLYGGDVTRRMKLLRKQARGKKKMKQLGKVEIGQEAFLAVLKR